MLSNSPFLFFVCALGVFNCFLVSMYFLIFEKRKRAQNVLFGLLTLLLSVRVAKTVYMSYGSSGNLALAQVGLSACFLIGVSLYYYLRAAVGQRERIPRSWTWHMTVLFLLILSVGLIWPYATHSAFWNRYVAWSIYVVWGSNLLLSAWVLKKELLAVLRPSKKKHTLNTWLVLVFLGNVLIFLAYLVGYYWLYYVEMISFSVVFYTLMVFFLIRKDRNAIFKNAGEKYGTNKIDRVEADRLSERLTLLMKEEQLYKKPALKLEELADRLGVSHHKLSQLLNDHMGTSFSTYINQYRVERAIALLQRNDLFTLEAIGYEAGFVSKSGFYAAFKKITGKTPSHFRKSGHS